MKAATQVIETTDVQLTPKLLEELENIVKEEVGTPTGARQSGMPCESS